MSAAYDRPSLRLGLFIPWLRTDMDITEVVNRVAAYFHENAFVFRLHWGKALPTARHDSEEALHLMRNIRNAFPRLEDFKDFVEDEDPHHVFRSRYWSRALWQ